MASAEIVTAPQHILDQQRLHHPTASGVTVSKQFQGGSHRHGAGVVGVVDDGRSPDLGDFAAHGRRREVRQGLGDFLNFKFQAQPHRHRGQGGRQVVSSPNMYHERATTNVERQPPISPTHVFCFHVGSNAAVRCAVRVESDRAFLIRFSSHEVYGCFTLGRDFSQPGVVRQHGQAVARQRGEQFGLLSSDGPATAKTAQVRVANGGNHSNGWFT